MASTTATRTAPAATPRQIDYLTTLATERGYRVEDGNLIAQGGATLALSVITKAMASSMITGLLATPKLAKAPAAAPTAPAKEELTDGMYQLPTGEIFKAQYAANGSGRLYAKALVVENHADSPEGPAEIEVRFEYAPGALRRLTPADKMSKEAAREFGQLYGVCCICGRTLTDEESIRRGTGKVCDGRM